MPSFNKRIQYSRRALLKQAVASVAITPLLLGVDAPEPPHLHFPAAVRDRLSITSYPFRALIESPTNPARDKNKPGMDLREFPKMIAERFGVHNINPLGDHLSSLDTAYLNDFRKSLDAAKSHIVDLGIGGKDFCNPESAAEAVDYGRKWIDIAKQLGSPSIRQHLKVAPGSQPSTAAAAESLSRLADYGAQKGTVINLENDAPGAEDPFFIVEVLTKVNHSYLRALPDFGNSLRGHDNAYNRRAVDSMFKHAYNMCHVKDVLRTREGQVYRVDVPDMFAVARANAYKGYFSMEFDTAAGDAFSGTENLVKLSLRYMLQSDQGNS